MLVEGFSQIYIWEFLVLFLIVILYIRLAVRFGLVDKRSERSSHEYATVRGGGIVFPLGIIWSIFYWDAPVFPLLYSILMVSILSFTDDVRDLKSIIRLVIQILSVGCLIYLSWPSLPAISMILLGFFFLGFMNIYNFMDGINGMLVFKTFVILLSLEYLNSLHDFTSPFLLHSTLISCIVFGFFNFRKNAKCFSGDIGSITLGLFMAYLLFELAEVTNIFLSLGLVMVFSVEAGLTILERLIRRENIFQAHRSHLYQLLANEVGLSHLTVSVIYGVAQAVISAGMILTYSRFPSFPIFFIFMSLIVILYIPLKLSIRRKYKV